MWSSRQRGRARFAFGAIAGTLALAWLQGCTVEPLNASTTVSSGAEATPVNSALASTEVVQVTTREAQQVRNALLFAMNGGQLQPGGKYKVKLTVTSNTQLLSAQRLTRASTVGQVQIKADYLLTEKEGDAFVASGSRTALTSFDRKPQAFANQRAERDAVNRAAKDVAQQIRLALGQIVAEL